MTTDPSRIRVLDPGHTEICNVYPSYNLFSQGNTCQEVYDWCAGAKKGCADCKKNLADENGEGYVLR